MVKWRKDSIGENTKIKILICLLLLVIRLLNLCEKSVEASQGGFLVFLVFCQPVACIVGKHLVVTCSCHCIIKCCLFLLAAHGLLLGYACFPLCLQFLWLVDS